MADFSEDPGSRYRVRRSRRAGVLSRLRPRHQIQHNSWMPPTQRRSNSQTPERQHERRRNSVSRNQHPAMPPAQKQPAGLRNEFFSIVGTRQISVNDCSGLSRNRQQGNIWTGINDVGKRSTLREFCGFDTHSNQSDRCLTVSMIDRGVFAHESDA